MRRPGLISFVIPVYNDARRLRACLASIARAAGGAAEIIVIDNGSDDGSDRVAREMGATVVSLPHVKVGELRNRGAALASGSVLAFVDADNEIAPGWVDAALETLDTRQRIVAVGAPYSAPTCGTWVQRAYDTLRSRPAGVLETEWLGSGNMAVARHTFERVGGFDTALDTCEDVDLCRRIRALGLRVVTDSRMHSVHHGDPETLRAVFFGELWRGRDNLRVSLRPPLTARMLASLAVPAIHLAALGAIVVGLVVALAGSPGAGAGLSAAGAIVFGFVVLGRALRMLRNHGAGATLQSRAGTVLVAAAYELARALALAGGAGHRRRRQAGAA